MGITLSLNNMCVCGLAVGLAKVGWVEKTPGFRSNFQDAQKLHEDTLQLKRMSNGMFASITMSRTVYFSCFSSEQFYFNL